MIRVKYFIIIFFICSFNLVIVSLNALLAAGIFSFNAMSFDFA